jgi:hypothetical protein
LKFFLILFIPNSAPAANRYSIPVNGTGAPGSGGGGNGGHPEHSTCANPWALDTMIKRRIKTNRIWVFLIATYSKN